MESVTKPLRIQHNNQCCCTEKKKNKRKDETDIDIFH